MTTTDQHDVKEIKTTPVRVNDMLKNIATKVSTISSVVAPRCPHKQSNDFSEFLTINELPGSQTAALIWAYYVSLRTEFEVDIKVTGNPRVSYTNRDDEVKSVTRDEHMPDDAKVREVTPELWEFAKEVLAKAPKHLYELIAAQQVSPLEEKNLESYYKAATIVVTVGTVLRILPFLSAKVPNIAGTDGFGNMVSGSKWLKYHTAATSTPGLVQQLIEGIEGFLPISDQLRAVVTKAMDNPWDGKIADQIPRGIVAVTYIFLEVMGKLPAKWYQGEKAMGLSSPVLLAKWRNLFVKYKSLAANEAGVLAATTLEQLVAVADSMHLSI